MPAMNAPRSLGDGSDRQGPCCPTPRPPASVPTCSLLPADAPANNYALSLSRIPPSTTPCEPGLQPWA